MRMARNEKNEGPKPRMTMRSCFHLLVLAKAITGHPDTATTIIVGNDRTAAAIMTTTTIVHLASSIFAADTTTTIVTATVVTTTTTKARRRLRRVDDMRNDTSGANTITTIKARMRASRRRTRAREGIKRRAVVVIPRVKSSESEIRKRSEIPKKQKSELRSIREIKDD